MRKDPVCFLIDDDADDQEIFSLALADSLSASKCVTANNGTEALTKLTTDGSFTPDFIFLDLNMPCMNGKECLEKIRQIPRLNNIPVIVYSTSSDPRHVMETKDLGAAHFLVKPTSIGTLIKILSDFFSQKSLPFSLNSEMC